MSKFILLADDSPDDVEFFKDTLQKADIVNPVRVVRDGAEAIDYLQGAGNFADRDTHPFPSILILDLMMPNRDGWDVLKWLQDRPEKSNLLIIVVTSYAHQSRLHEAYALGASSFLIKPLNKNELDGLIRHWPDAWMLSTNCRYQRATSPIPRHSSPEMPQPAPRAVSVVRQSGINPESL